MANSRPHAWPSPATQGLTPANSWRLPLDSSGSSSAMSVDLPAARLLLGGRGWASDAMNLVATGGTGDLVLAAASGRPGIESWPLTLNAAGVCWVRYRILDPVGWLLEDGWGRITVSTRTLARTKLLWTGSGTASIAVASPTAASIPVGAEVHFELIAAGPDQIRNAFFNSTVGSPDAIGLPAPQMLNFTSTGAVSTWAAIAGQEMHSTYPWSGGYMRSISVIVAATPAGTMKWIIAECLSNGMPGAVLVNGNATPFDTSTTGNKTITLNKFIHYQPLWISTISSSTPTMVAGMPEYGYAGTAAGGYALMWYRAGSHATGFSDPAQTALTAWGAAATIPFIRAA